MDRLEIQFTQDRPGSMLDGLFAAGVKFLDRSEYNADSSLIECGNLKPNTVVFPQVASLRSRVDVG